MRGLEVLQLTDVQKTVNEFYSKQYEMFLKEEGAEHIDETCYYLTGNNIIIDIETDIDECFFEDVIRAGAEIKTMYYVEDNEYSNHQSIECFQKLKYESVKGDEEQGVLFDVADWAEEYERKLDRVQKIKEALPEPEIIDIIDSLDSKKIAQELCDNFGYQYFGVKVCIDLRDGDVWIENDEVCFNTPFIRELFSIHKNSDLDELYVAGIVEGGTITVEDAEEKEELLKTSEVKKHMRVITKQEEKEEIFEGLSEEISFDISGIFDFYKID